ncbi:MAG: hypothetical protein JJT89_13530 [Nitriliruptoraceae bacterium]|nr:hypothetical protein [Nitriliruptoraceae bacterium]
MNEEVRREISDLRDVAKVLHYGVRAAALRYRALTEQLEDGAGEDWEAKTAGTDCDELDAWMDAMVAELVGDGNGVPLVFEGATFAEEYLRFGIPVPESAPWRREVSR